MKNIKWLANLAGKNPLIFSLTLLMIAVSVLGVVVADRDKKISECNEEKKTIYKRIDSLEVYYRDREVKQSEEVKAVLRTIIDNYKEQLKEQKDLNSKINKTLKRNKNLIGETNTKIKTLK